jgi:GT2 family glycosyltransferase
MEKKEAPRVLVGCVTHDKDEVYLNEFLKAIRSQDYSDYDILFVDTSDNEEYSARLRGTGSIVKKGNNRLVHPIERVTSGRKIVREYAINKGYDHVWFVDTDVVPPEDALSKLISRNKHIVAGLCLVSTNIEGSQKVTPNIYLSDKDEQCIKPLNTHEVMNNDLIEISCAGFGCVLLSRDAFSNVPIRYFEGNMAGEDMAFFTDAKEKGFKAFADNSVKCKHLVFPPGDPRNKKFRF